MDQERDVMNELRLAASRLPALLRETTERLAAELAQPGPDAPEWEPVTWRVAMAAAVIHGISGLLAERLLWTGPEIWEAFLADQHHQMRLREQRIRGVLQGVDAEARREGVPVIGLKGSALLALGLYAPGLRPMADIDLLVRPGDREVVLRLLGRLDYRPGFDSGRHLTLLPASTAAKVGVHFGEHAAHPVKIELHTRVAEPLPLREIDITHRILTPEAEPGLCPYPNQVALMRHLALHTAGNMRAHSMRLIQLHDLALMADRLADSDWSTLAGCEETGDHGPDEGLRGAEATWWALPPLRMTERHFPRCAIDEHRLRLFEAGCPPWLRRHAGRAALSDLSVSRGAISILPGLAWSRGPADMLRLMRHRVWPGRKAARLRRELCSSEAWMKDSRWVQLPHATRIAYLLLGARPSVAAQFSVRQALAYRAP